jgi:cell wall assembly regulator SMI1
MKRGNAMTSMDEILNEIQRYSGGLRRIYPGAQESAIESFEKYTSLRLPEDFRQFLMRCNGFSIMSDVLYGIHPENEAIDLLSNYFWERNESGNPIYRFLVPIMPDGQGNNYCLDLSRGGHSQATVVFWQHDYDYEFHSEIPDIVAHDFLSFLRDTLADIRDEYDYDGNHHQQPEN